MSDLTYQPSYTTSGSDEYKELRADFGDGYVQTAPDGINPVKEKWNLVYDPIPADDVETLREFFRSKAGKTFTWTRAGAAEKRYRRIGEVGWSITGNGGSVNVTIEEAFSV